MMREKRSFGGKIETSSLYCSIIMYVVCFLQYVEYGLSQCRLFYVLLIIIIHTLQHASLESGHVVTQWSSIVG